MEEEQRRRFVDVGKEEVKFSWWKKWRMQEVSWKHEGNRRKYLG